MKRIGTVGRGILTSRAWRLYFVNLNQPSLFLMSRLNLHSILYIVLFQFLAEKWDLAAFPLA